MLSTKIGFKYFDNCILNASGCLCSNIKQLNDLSNTNIGAIVCKTSTLHSREGNQLPRQFFDNYGSINSMGLPNNNFKYYLEYGIKSKKTFIHSIAVFSIGELKLILNTINQEALLNNLIYTVELNLSCPNVLNKSIVAYDFTLFKEYLKYIKNMKLYNICLGLKLPPYYTHHDFDIVSQILLEFRDIIYFITCINSIVNGLLIDYINEETLINPNNGFGGIGGLYCKPIALANIHQFYKRLNNKIDIIGCGGISSGQDIFEMILSGASLVQIGSNLIKEGLPIFERLNIELIKCMTDKGYSSICEFKGKLKIKSAL